MNPAHDEMVRKAVAGDIDAISHLLRAHGPVIQNRLQIGAQWQAMLQPEDVMQVTYLEAFLQISRFDPARSDSFEGWLNQIAQNNLRDAIRGLSRQKHPQPGKRIGEVQAPGSESVIGLLEMLGVTSATPSREAAHDEMADAVHHALASLPADYAAVVTAYDLQGRSITEVAEAMKRSTGAVHMLRCRAHDRLKELLGRESQFFSTPS